jgi:hypothetical protein
MSTADGNDDDTPAPLVGAWRAHSGWRRQGLVRRGELLRWLLDGPTRQGLSAKEIAEHCELYAGERDPYRAVLADLRVMEDYYCWVARETGRPVRWAVTAIGVQAAPSA